MLQARPDRRLERIAAARALAGEGRVDELRGAVAELQADLSITLTADDQVILAVALSVALTNCEDFPAARAELERVRPLLPAVSALTAAMFHTCLGLSVGHRAEDGSGDEAIASIVLALASVESVSEAGRDLALVLRNCGMRLAMEQLFPLAVETAQRGVAVAEAAGLAPGQWMQSVGYASLCWAMRLEHLGLDDEAAGRWRAADEQFAGAIADPDNSLLLAALARANRAIAASRLGRPEDGRANLEESRDTPARPVTSLLRRRRLHAECAVLTAERRYADARHLLTAYWQEATRLRTPPFSEDGAFLLARIAEAEGRPVDALRWYREVHERYGRAQYEGWVSRATAARLRVEQEALLRRARQLEYDALSDPLTGVPNRRAFDADLPRLVGDAQAAGSPLTLAILDVDRFKRVNDTHGHLVGDEVLRTVALLLRQHMVEADRCARYGGDEFVLALPAAAGEADATVRRIVRAVREHRWSEVAAGLRVTVTAGLAELGPNDTSTTLFWVADQSLLAAKRAR
ncbi:MAG: diguanylate cyclase domain-containing protein [Mycobacteriales bacterium]